MWTIYRPDFQRLLATEAEKEGAEFTFSAKVAKVDADAVTVYLVDGQEFQGDLIVGADGTYVSKTSYESKIRQAYGLKPELAYRNATTLNL